MRSLEEITAKENEYVRQEGGTLGLAYEWLSDRWFKGARDRETSLRLLFLRWYLLVEPVYLTGAAGEQLTDKDVDRQLWDSFKEAEVDAELSSIVQIMIDVADWALPGNIQLWREIARQGPERLDESIFEGRGAYGDYFSHMIR